MEARPLSQLFLLMTTRLQEEPTTEHGKSCLHIWVRLISQTRFSTLPPALYLRVDFITACNITGMMKETAEIRCSKL